MKHVISGIQGKPSANAPIIAAVDVYQSSCWHCHLPFDTKPIEEKDGLRCPACNELNYYGPDFMK